MADVTRIITFVKAINETLHLLMEQDKDIILIGQGITSPWYVGGTCDGLLERFGRGRIIDTPVSENAVTGVAVGAALTGLRPILVHPRMDFMYLAMDQIANHAANWYYMFGGQLSIPITIWAIINRGGEQGAQHSQSLQAIYAHIPGLKVVMPSSPATAKGLLVSSVRDSNPVIYVDDRWLYEQKGDVGEDLFSIPIGKASVIRKGVDITIISSSYMTVMAINAARQLDEMGISVEIVDLLSVKPLDEYTMLTSVSKTGRAIVLDGGWRSFGISAEISATIAEQIMGKLKRPVIRVALPDVPAPSSSALEKVYYPSVEAVVLAVKKGMGRSKPRNI